MRLFRDGRTPVFIPLDDQGVFEIKVLDGDRVTAFVIN